MIIGEINPDVDTIPGDKAGDDVVGERDNKLIIIVIVFAIIFAYASKWWRV